MYEISKTISTVLLQQDHTYSYKPHLLPLLLLFISFKPPHIQTAVSPSSIPTSSLPLDLVLLCFSQERAGLKEISSKQGITRFNKTEHKPSYQGWSKEPSIKKSVPKGCKCVRDALIPIARSLKTLQHISRGPNLEPCWHCDCHFSFWELAKKHV